MVVLYNKGTHPTLNWFETGLTPQDHVGIHGCKFVFVMNRETLFLFQERLFFIDATLNLLIDRETNDGQHDTNVTCLI